jgi:hypothetical protein
VFQGGRRGQHARHLPPQVGTDVGSPLQEYRSAAPPMMKSLKRLKPVSASPLNLGGQVFGAISRLTVYGVETPTPPNKLKRYAVHENGDWTVITVVVKYF